MGLQAHRSAPVTRRHRQTICSVTGAGTGPGNGETMTDQTKKQELRSFAFLTIVVAPALAGALIVSYGFLVWFYQMFAGPPHV